MSALQPYLLDFCPVNVFRPTFPDGLSAATRATMVDIYNEAFSLDPDGYNSRLKDVYSVDSDANITIDDYNHMLKYYSEVLPRRSHSFGNLVKLNLQGCVWRTTPSLYTKLKHSFQGVDGDANYTWTAVLCTLILMTSMAAASLKVSSSYTWQFAYSIATLVLYNTYFMFTRFGEYPLMLVAIHLITVALFCVGKPRRPSLRRDADNLTSRFANMVTNLRGSFMVATIIAILAYDNLYFNRRCSKTFFSGYSSMDVGCGFMIIHSGCMTSFSRKASSRTFFGIIKRNLGLFLLGIIRLLATTAVSYDVPVEEYGVHWNFFMSLGMTKLVSELLLTVLPDRMLAAVPLGIMIPLELVIYYFDMVRQFPRIARTNVLTANKEGIIAIPNSISMFFIGYLVTRLCANLYKEKRQVSSAMVALGASLMSLCGSVVLFKLGLPSSRTLGNMRFVMNTSSIVFSGLFLFMLLDMAPDGFFYMEVWRCIGKHSFAYFILANVMTGAINLFVPPLLLPFAVMYTLVSIYAAICCIFTLYLERHNISALE